MSLEKSITRSWYRSNGGWTWCFAPMLLFSAPYVRRKREQFLRHRTEVSYQSRLPVIVVGNISVGGTGKSPMVMALAALLKSQGFSPGIVTRGHKRHVSEGALLVKGNSTALEVGDEPLMLYRRSGCPVAVATRRVDALKRLESETLVDVVISDDGLQHYAMDRDIEIIMVDAKRGLGNRQLLPVGPLREPADRLESADFAFAIGDQFPLQLKVPSFHGKLVLQCLTKVGDSTQHNPLSELKKGAWTVIAGIGNPDRFLDSLHNNGLADPSQTLFYSDHHQYIKDDFPSAGNVIMTEKDAVKAEAFATAGDTWWYTAAELELPDAFKNSFLERLHHTVEQKTKTHE